MSGPLSAVDLEKAHEPKEVDVSAAGRGVWLVKVPKYLSEQWKKCQNGKDVGKLKISKSKVPNKKPDIVFTSYDMTAKQAAISSVVPPSVGSFTTLQSGPRILPQPQPVAMRSNNLIPLRGSTNPPSRPASGIRNHKFIVTNVGNQNLVVMSQNKAGKEPIPGKEAAPDKVYIEGKVLQRAECHPIVDDNYKLLKKEQVQAQNTPVRQMKLLPGIVQNYKPVSDHYENMEERKAKKTEAKRTRAEKDKVMDILFNAFEKHQFYNVKDLVGITKQPVPYLKEILKEICIYNMTAPHKNMWELKPEFRHYKGQDEET